MALWDRPPDTTDRGYDPAEGWPTPSAGNLFLEYDEESAGATRRQGLRVQHTSGVEYRLGSDPVSSHAERRAIEGGRMDILRRMIFAAHRDHSRLIYLAAGPKFEGVTLNTDSAASFNFSDFALYEAQNNGTQVTIRYEPGAGGDPAALVGSRSGLSLPMSIAPGMVARAGEISAQVLDARFLSGGRLRLYLSKALTHATELGVALIWENEPPGYAAPRLELPAAVLDEGPPYPCVNDVATHHQIFSSWAALNPGAFTAQGIAPGRYCTRINSAGVDLSKYKDGDYCRNVDCPFYEAHTPATPQPGDYSFLHGSRGTYFRQLLPGFPDSWNLRVGREGPTGFLMLLGFKLGYFVQELNIFVGWKNHEDRGIARWRLSQTDPDTGYDIYLNFEEYQAWLLAQGLPERDDVGLLGWMAQFSQISDGTQLGREIPAGGEEGEGYPQATFLRAIGLTRMQGTGYNLSDGPAGRGVFDIQRPRPRRFTSPVFTPGEAGTLDNGETRLRVWSEPQTLETRGGDFSYDLLWEVPRFGRTIGPERPPRRLGKEHGSGIHSISNAGGRVTIEFNLGSYVGAVPSGVTFEPGIPDIKRRSYRAGGSVVRFPYAAWSIWNPYSLQRLGDPHSGLMPGDVLRFQTGDLAGVALLCVEARACFGSVDASEPPLDPGLTASMPPTLQAVRTRRDWARFQTQPGDDKRLADYLAGGGPGYAGDWTIEQSAVIEDTSAVEVYTRDPATGAEAVRSLSFRELRIDRTKGELRIRADGWDPALVHRLHLRAVVWDEEERHTLENGRALMRWPAQLAEKAWWPFALGGGTLKAAEYWIQYRQPNGSISEETSIIEMVQIPDDPLDPVNDPFPTVWSSPNLETHEESSNSAVILDQGMRVTGDAGAGEFGHALNDFSDHRGDWGLQLDTPLLPIGPSLTVGRLAAEDVAEARIDLRLGTAEARRVTWNLFGLVASSELLDSFPVRPTILAGPDDQHLSLREDLTPAVGSLTRLDQGGGEYKYQGTIDVTAAVRWVIDHGGELDAGELVAYLALMFTDVASVTDVASYANSLLEASSWDGGGHYVGVTRQLLYETIALNNLQIRFGEAAVKRGALYHYNERGQAPTPDLTWFPGKAF